MAQTKMAAKKKFREITLKVNFSERDVDKDMINKIADKMFNTAMEITTVHGVDIDYNNRMFTATFDEEIGHEH